MLFGLEQALLVGVYRRSMHRWDEYQAAMDVKEQLDLRLAEKPNANDPFQ
jgi:hypothetical protein